MRYSARTNNIDKNFNEFCAIYILNCNLFSCTQREKHTNDIGNALTYDAYSYSIKWVQNKVSIPYKQRAFIIYDNDVTLSLT